MPQPMLDESSEQQLQVTERYDSRPSESIDNHSLAHSEKTLRRNVQHLVPIPT
jgi:hypothetical protein